MAGISLGQHNVKNVKYGHSVEKKADEEANTVTKTKTDYIKSVSVFALADTNTSGTVDYNEANATYNNIFDIVKKRIEGLKTTTSDTKLGELKNGNDQRIDKVWQSVAGTYAKTLGQFISKTGSTAVANENGVNDQEITNAESGLDNTARDAAAGWGAELQATIDVQYAAALDNLKKELEQEKEIALKAEEIKKQLLAPEEEPEEKPEDVEDEAPEDNEPSENKPSENKPEGSKPADPMAQIKDWSTKNKGKLADAKIPEEDQITYAKQGESFKATAERLGFKEGTEAYKRFVTANKAASDRSHGGWFKVGENVVVPAGLKATEGEILTKEQGQAEVEKWKQDNQPENQPPASDGNEPEPPAQQSEGTKSPFAIPDNLSLKQEHKQEDPLITGMKEFEKANSDLETEKERFKSTIDDLGSLHKTNEGRYQYVLRTNPNNPGMASISADLKGARSILNELNSDMKKPASKSVIANIPVKIQRLTAKEEEISKALDKNTPKSMYSSAADKTKEAPAETKAEETSEEKKDPYTESYTTKVYKIAFHEYQVNFKDSNGRYVTKIARNKNSIDDATEEINQKLKKAGYTNVTLTK